VQKTYKVWIWQENGDSLSKIAQKVYGDRTKWKLIYLANKDTIKDPNKIYPKQKLKIPPADWQPN
jgi:nucleoid-associated protein YgaU